MLSPPTFLGAALICVMPWANKEYENYIYHEMRIPGGMHARTHAFNK